MWRIFPECVKIVYYQYLTWKTYDLKVYFKIHDFSLIFKTFLPPPPSVSPTFRVSMVSWAGTPVFSRLSG